MISFHPKICGICPFTKTFLTRKLGGKPCILRGATQTFVLKIFSKLYKKALDADKEKKSLIRNSFLYTN